MVDYSKFPSVLKDVLKNGSYSFSKETQFKFLPLHAYRVISRPVSCNKFEITMDDFKSYAELGKKAPRGSKLSLNYYSCSFFSSIDALNLIMKLPRPSKKIIEGDLLDTYGPILTNEKTSHIDLWLYENTDIQNNFTIRDER